MTVDIDYRDSECATCTEGSDHVTCNNCGYEGSVSYETDACPKCDVLTLRMTHTLDGLTE